MRPASAGPCTKNLLEIKTAPSRVPAPKSFALVQKTGAIPSASAGEVFGYALIGLRSNFSINAAGVMRPGQTGRTHGRHNGNNTPYRNRQQMPHRGQTLDSNGPNVKIRGSSHQIFERYVALAREASTSGDRVAAENLYQHAEHYFRVMNAANEAHQHSAMRPTAPADLQTEMAEEERSEMVGPARASPSEPYSA